MRQTPKYQKCNSFYTVCSNRTKTFRQTKTSRIKGNQIKLHQDYRREIDTDGFGIPIVSLSTLHKLYRKAPPKSLSNQPLEYWTYPISVKAIYAYRGDDPDSETFSFEADEILIVQEVDGNWWPTVTKS